ncbi:MAG: enoyl-CoA hydratase-related protein [Thermodesulfobacteriota bacterium]|nr:enoyl-CoA hydratase-related protein [Thermodesulfobacteriota bacterium]
MDYETINLIIDGATATITMNRPAVLNAMTTQLGVDIRDALRIIRQNETLKVLILTGEGKAFCAGADMEEVLRVNADPILAERAVKVFLDCIEGIRTLHIPVISRVNGDAYGGGAMLALACDFKIAVETAKLGLLFVRVGLAGADAGATYLIPRLVGPTRAAEMLLLGEVVEAPEAYRLGMLTRVVPHESLDDEVARFVNRILNGPTLAIKMTKRALAGSLDKDLATELDFECYAQTLCIQSADAREGIKALKEKRKPLFQGK